MTSRSTGLIMTGIAIWATCAVPAQPMASADSTEIAQISAAASPVVARVMGSGHVMRNLTGEDELTTFSYNAVARADGTAHGEYQYHFRAADFFIHGTVTCASTSGNAGWVGGVIDRIVSGDPADQSLVGTEIWWRVVDNGEGADNAADLTTSLLFAVPGLPITAASWCRDQNVRGVLRDVLDGNIQVR
jgi:hypothetical protein